MFALIPVVICNNELVASRTLNHGRAGSFFSNKAAVKTCATLSQLSYIGCRTTLLEIMMPLFCEGLEVPSASDGIPLSKGVFKGTRVIQRAVLEAPGGNFKSSLQPTVNKFHAEFPLRVLTESLKLSGL